MQVLSVGELTHYVRSLLEADTLLSAVTVRGEICDLKAYASGHVYFSIKDAQAILRCVAWRSTALRLTSTPVNGQQVVVRGRLVVYEKNGHYQLVVSDLRQEGVGDLYQAFLRLKERLTAEGLFDTARKRPVCLLPRRVGLVTSAGGAALQDMLTTLSRRHPGVDVVLSPAQVQGAEAPMSLVAALHRLWRLHASGVVVDTIIVGRGGGSFEDLNAFNDERLVRAVAESPVPVISGVGHETDTTLCDFAADLRAVTPTAAATAAVPLRQDLLTQQRALDTRLHEALAHRLERARLVHGRLHAGLLRLHPVRRIEAGRQSLDLALERLVSRTEAQLARQRTHFSALTARLDALSPLRVLTRGFSVCRTPDQQVLKSICQVMVGSPIEILLADGRLEAEVRQVEPR